MTIQPSFFQYRGKGFPATMFLLCWITYAGFYLGRFNLSGVLPKIASELHLSKVSLGAVGTALFVAYAVGQVVNSQLGQYIAVRRLVTVGLLAPAVLNLTFGLNSSYYGMLILWTVNGYFQAMWWTPNVNFLSKEFPVKVHGRLSGLLGSSYLFGSALSVTVSGYLADHYGWRTAFFYVEP